MNTIELTSTILLLHMSYLYTAQFYLFALKMRGYFFIRVFLAVNSANIVRSEADSDHYNVKQQYLYCCIIIQSTKVTKFIAPDLTLISIL